MNGLSFSPALGWPAGIAIALAMLVFAVGCVALHIRRAGESDETLAMCIRRCLICVLIAIMALTPSVVSSTTSRAVNATDVIVAVDVTGSMAVDDASYGSQDTVSRLDAAKQAVHDLTGMYADASFAALRFGVSATVDVPLTPDTLAIGNWADALTTEPTSLSTGSSLDVPIDQLLLTCKNIHEQRPDDAIILYIISDGEQTSSRTRRTFSSLRRYVDDAFTVGVGSAKGGKIPLVESVLSSDESTAASEWVTDPETGEPGISRLDADMLTSIADEMSGSYIATNATQTVDTGLSAKASDRWHVTSTVKERTRVSPVTWPFAIAILALLAYEAGAWIVTSRRLL